MEFSKPIDKKTGFDVSEEFETFDQRNEIYCRSDCIRVCPYNRDFSKWYNRLWRRLAGSGLRKLMLRIDVHFHKRARMSSKEWWSG